MNWLFWRKAKPTPKPLDLSAYQGWWVAVRGDKVLACGRTTKAIMDMLARRPDAGHGATIWFVEPENRSDGA